MEKIILSFLSGPELSLTISVSVEWYEIKYQPVFVGSCMGPSPTEYYCNLQVSNWISARFYFQGVWECRKNCVKFQWFLRLCFKLKCLDLGEIGTIAIITKAIREVQWALTRTTLDLINTMHCFSYMYCIYNKANMK